MEARLPLGFLRYYPLYYRENGMKFAFNRKNDYFCTS